MSRISRVSSVLVFSSSSSPEVVVGLLPAGTAACRFWPIITKVDRKIASSETTNVSVGHGLFSRSSIHSANTRCVDVDERIDPANAVMESAIRS